MEEAIQLHASWVFIPCKSMQIPKEVAEDGLGC